MRTLDLGALAEQPRLTVLQLVPALDAGGVERGTLEIANALVSAGHRSVVMSRGGRMVADLQAHGSEHYEWAVGRKSPATLWLVPRLRRFLEEASVDVMHARSRAPAWVGFLAWRAMNSRTRPRFVTTVHGLYSVSPYSAVMLRGERVIAVSKTVRRYIEASYPKTDLARVQVIPRGVEASEFPKGYQPDQRWRARWEAEFPGLRGQRLVTIGGRLTRLKGHEAYIDVLARTRELGPAVHGLVVGETGGARARYTRHLKAAAARRGIPLTFTGYRDDVREIFAISDAVLSLSSKPESFGRSVLEALCLGVPVIAYDHGGVGEIMAKMFPLGAVPAGDVGAAAARLADWLVNGAPVPGDNDYPRDRMLGATVELYQDLAGAGRGRGAAGY